MKPFNAVKNIFVAAAIACALTWQASGTIVYDNPSGLGTGQGGGPWALGLDFTVNTAGYVTAMGAYDDNGDGFSGTVPVAIYYVSGFGALDGTIVGGTVVNFSGSSDTLIGGSRFQSITPVLLTPGVYSVVGANFGTGNTFHNAVTGPAYSTFDSVGGALTIGSWRDGGPGNSTLVFPISDIGGVGGNAFGTNPRWTAATFDFAVPEASQFAMAGIGLLGLIYISRAYVLRNKLA